MKKQGHGQRVLEMCLIILLVALMPYEFAGAETLAITNVDLRPADPDSCTAEFQLELGCA
jgi:hypothetical protein